MTSTEITKDTLLIKQLSSYIITNKDTEFIYKIHSIIIKDEFATECIVQMAKIDLLGIFVLTAHNSEDTEYKMNEDKKIHMLQVVSAVLSHNKLDKNEMLLFLNLYGSLVQEVYKLETSTLKITSEELKWEVLNCVRLLFEAVTENLCLLLYTKENAMRLCKIIYIVAEVLKSKCRRLKSEAIKCLMAMFRVNTKSKIDHFVCNSTIAKTLADSYSYFLPGIALSLGSIILEGSIVGGSVLELTIEAMGKIMTILLNDYEKKRNSFEDAKAAVICRLNPPTESKFEAARDIKENFMKMQRTWKWFETSDEHLAPIFAKFTYLTDHQSHEVRLKLAEMCISLIKHCYKTIPRSTHSLVEMLIILSDSEDEKISNKSKELFDLPILGERIKNIVSDRFYHIFSRIPTIFNGIDTVQQVNILKLTSASLKIVRSKIKCNESFKEFQRTLLYICEVEIQPSSFVEVISQEDFDGDCPDPVELWKGFKFMQEEAVRKQFDRLCRVIFEINLFPVLSDYLINIITFGEEKTEALFLMNRLLHGINVGKLITEGGLMYLVMSPFETYIDNWDVPLEITSDEEECNTLKALRINTLQAALMCEGVGLMANHAREEEHLRPFLFNSMYKILIRAASSHYIIRTAATKALQDMATGLEYSNVSEMLNDNMDYLFFYVERGLKASDTNGDVFRVMEKVMRFGEVSILQRFSDWINEVLIHSFDKFKQDRIDSYLRVFRVFLKRLMKWYNVKTPSRREFETWKRKKEAIHHFEVSGLDDEEVMSDFSDKIMGKTAYEMYLEDLEKGKVEDSPVSEESYQKPTPPKPIQITVEILKRSLNFLPSKDMERKLLVLEILRNGIEIIREHEDEVLPVVHLIWSPLVQRFKDDDSPVLLNFSFQLLVTMGRVSKDFIRNRTSTDVLPNVLSKLNELANKNHKDTSVYSVDYKLQMKMLEHMFSLIHDMELLEKDIDAILNTVILYTRDNQPTGLKIEAYNFLKLLAEYNPAYEKQVMDALAEDVRSP